MDYFFQTIKKNRHKNVEGLNIFIILAKWKTVVGDREVLILRLPFGIFACTVN